MGIAPERAPTVRLSLERGLVPGEPEAVGDPLGEIPPFALPESRSADFADRLPRLLRPAGRAVMNAVLRPLPRVQPEKCNVRCLRKLYLAAQKDLRENMTLLMEQTYNRMLETEQLIVGWEGGE